MTTPPTTTSDENTVFVPWRSAALAASTVRDAEAPTDQANLVFLPWVRSGASAAIDTVDTLTTQAGTASVNVALTVNGTSQAPPVSVRLRGPADVVGVDANQIIRTDPAPNTTDFEAGNFAAIEFDRADFPWLFTPAAANADGKLRPWLCLVVVQKQNGVTLSSTPDAPLPVLQIAAPAKPALELPDLADSWAWAHAQAAPDSPDSTLNPDHVKTALDEFPQRSLSRLICPRVLAPNTEYIACVVPTFDLSAQTGLGTAVAGAELGAASLTPAWKLNPAPASVKLPVYYHWEFRTGIDGTFASLVAKLRARPVPQQVGRRTIDIGQPGFAPDAGFPDNATIDMEGALRAIVPPGSPDVSPAWPAGAEAPFESALSKLLNIPNVIAAGSPPADPVVGPTLYGRWHVKDATVAPGPGWYDQVNLDPRLRTIAAFGTRVVQHNQEALMASAWEQAGELEQANQRLRQLQMSVVVGDRLTARHFSRLPFEHALRVGAPLFGQLAPVPPAPGGRSFPTLAAQLPSTGVPSQAVTPAMRRVGRLRGPITRRIATQGLVRANLGGTWIAAFTSSGALLPALSPSALASVSVVDNRMAPVGTVQAFGAVTADAVNARGPMPYFTVVAEGQPVNVALSQLVPGGPFESFPSKIFRRAAHDHLARVKPDRGTGPLPPHPNVTPPSVGDMQTAFSNGTVPTATVAAVARVTVSGNATRATIGPRAAAAAPTGASPIAPLVVTPAFPQSMAESLRDLSQDLLLPGLDNVPPDTVLGLETNRRFVEAYMLGLNVEMSRELLWRGFPTDQRGTYFRNFWKSSQPDIKDINVWGTASLGDPSLSPESSDRFVMLIRSSLLRRYPDALIYLTPAIASGGGRVPSERAEDELLPVFSCSMQPDVTFFGFDISTDAAVGVGGSLGYYVVIQEHPTAPRFGLQNSATIPTGTTHVAIGTAPPDGQATLGLSWGLNSATTAAIVRHRPTRLAIHASQFLSAPQAIVTPPPPPPSPTPSGPPGPIGLPPHPIGTPK